MRKVKFINNEFYHVYNRGIDKRGIYKDEKDYFNFLKALKEFNNKSFYEERLQILQNSGYNYKKFNSFLNELEKIVEIVAYCLLPNHFHLILKQLKEKGIIDFMHKVGTGFTNYFNKKYNRSGSLFQGPYKAIHIDNNRYLLWLSGYVNGNAEIHKIHKVEFYKWSSLKHFINIEKNKSLKNQHIILSQFNNPEEYKKFIKQVVQESKEKKEMKNYLLEELE